MKKKSSPQRTQFIMMFFAFAFGMILSNLLNTQSQNKVAVSNEEVLFIYRGVEKTLNDISETDRENIRELNQKKVTLIENAALKQYFLDEEHKQKIDIEQLAKVLLKWEAVSDAEINRFYQENKERIKKPFFEVKTDIKKNLELKRAGIARQRLIEKLKVSGDLAILPMS